MSYRTNKPPFSGIPSLAFVAVVIGAFAVAAAQEDAPNTQTTACQNNTQEKASFTFAEDQNSLVYHINDQEQIVEERSENVCMLQLAP